MSLFYDCADPAERAEGLAAAVDSISRGELVVLPVDASYGLAADAFQPDGVDGLLAAKGRGRDLPVPVLVGSWTGLDGLMLYVRPAVRELVEAFWPGGLTLVVEHAPSLAWDLGDSRGTVAVRMPLHPVALELLARTGPLAVSAANRAGQPVPMTAADAQEQLGYPVSVYLDGGVCEPQPSTIVDVSEEVPRLLRAGSVTLEQLREVVPELVAAG
ncbi:MAG: Threonylcarbamoyl-AMP synthase [uncultured Corynebacteriales bacterium]|uniref:L-threonylcarbamoyladenylate synthase n=1 Tax=uncultured Mycobacteriales bacterium TaxID=581187 RepID=A0A6J4J4U3_9ACTN|nr:MAG: Threonylcarbamoyl-AMP synthase [uncultured Corynebacteriales bacterium]